MTLNGTDTPAVTFLDAPDALPVANFEGFATATAELCSNGVRPVWWFQDGIEQGSLRTGTLPCAGPSSSPSPSNPGTTTPAPTTSVPSTSGSQTPGVSPSPSAPGTGPTKPPALPDTGRTDALFGMWGLVVLAGLGVAAVLRRHRS